jgi:hypothetical protein
LAAVEARIVAYKILANGLYGSTIVNQERHSETKMVDTSNKKSIKNSISSLRFKSLYHAGDKTLINSTKSTYSLSYPLSLGSAILWESKIIMIRFVYSLYDYLGKHGLKMNPLITDTDSYYTHIPDFLTKFDSIDQFTFKFNNEVYKVFDTTANKPEYQMPETHEEFCCMKNETKNKTMVEFNGICSKVYSKELVKAQPLREKAFQKSYRRNISQMISIDVSLMEQVLKKTTDVLTVTSPQRS